MSNVSNVYLMHGFIGAGKTTFAKKLEKETGAIRFTPDEIIANRYGVNLSMDEIRSANISVKSEIWEKVKNLIASNKDLILDYGFWKKIQRDEMKNQIRELGGKPIFYEIVCELNLMKKRALIRGNETDISITPERYEEYYKRFEPMGSDEERITIRTDS